GYGKCVYLRLEDGKTAVYAHLSEFAGALADTVQAIQQSRGTVLFDREFPKGALPVERGDLIARTGQSGAGPPHLHFEIRDEQERALDPLAYGIAAPDRTPPRITRIALTPLTPESLVDGDSRTVIVDVDHENGAAVADRIVPVAGRIGIAMEARDSIDACERRLAPKRWELREGTTTLFAVNVDRFTFDEWDLVDLHFDPRYSYSNRGNFMNLWKRTGNDFPAVVGNWPAADGVAGNGAAQRALTLAVVDAAGNRSEASLILDFAAGAVKNTPPNPTGDAGRLPELENHGAWIEARFPRNAAPALPSWMAAGWKPVAEGSTPRHVVTAAEFSSSQVPVRSTLVHANAEGRITTSDSIIEVRFPAGTLREDTIVLLRETPLPSHSKELEPAGSLYKIDTGIVPLAGSYKIEARPPSSSSGRRELLALYVHTGGYFRYIGGAEGKELFSGSTQWPTAFGLFEDSKPPTFGQGRIVRRGRERRIELRVRDGGAGLECDDIQVLVNGRRLLHEYDSETTLVSAILTSAPSAGSSIQVRIDATDRVGNSASSTQTLRARK
ncbi:MAG TPA: M23 family metallopeptidase, partial [bacterium]|nr:M23 family metallopeptidase [bacterium]